MALKIVSGIEGVEKAYFMNGTKLGVIGCGIQPSTIEQALRDHCDRSGWRHIHSVSDNYTRRLLFGD